MLRTALPAGLVVGRVWRMGRVCTLWNEERASLLGEGSEACLARAWKDLERGSQPDQQGPGWKWHPMPGI